MSKNIFFVEDNDIDYWSIERSFANSSNAYHFTRYTSAEECLQDIKVQQETLKHQINLFYIDINLPGLNGDELVSQLKQLGLPKMILVMLSSSENDLDIRRCLNAGADAYVVKAEQLSDFSKDLLITTHFWLEVAKHA